MGNHYVFTTLFSNAFVSQKDFLALLKLLSVPHVSLWISNSVVVYGVKYNFEQSLLNENENENEKENENENENANPVLIYLNSLFKQQKEQNEQIIYAIEPFKRYKVVPLTLEDIRTDNNNRGNDNFINWGIPVMKADRAWKAGFNGKDMVIAEFGTGVDGRHKTLTNTHRKKYGWFDAVSDASVTSDPVDNIGHGTIAMSIAAGSSSFGVSITNGGSKWISTRVCRRNNNNNDNDDDVSCRSDHIELGAQWIICPSANGIYTMDTQCEKNPDIVLQTFGSDVSRDRGFEDILNAFIASRIVTVVATGYGDSCSSLWSPADYQSDWVISVASASLSNVKNVNYFVKKSRKSDDEDENDDEDDNGFNYHIDNDVAANSLLSLSPHSARGPIVFAKGDELLDKHYTKPDFTCPGQTIKAAWIDSPDSFVLASGTIVAAANMAGVLAITLASPPGFDDFVGVYEQLARNGRMTFMSNLEECGGNRQNSFGYGIIDICDTIKGLGEKC